MKNKDLIKLLLDFPLDAEVTTYSKDWGDYESNFRLEPHLDITLVEYGENKPPKLINVPLIIAIIV